VRPPQSRTPRNHRGVTARIAGRPRIGEKRGNYGSCMNATFLERFSDPAPSLQVQFLRGSNEPPTTVSLEHSLKSTPSRHGLAFLKSLPKNKALAEFVAFFKKHDGFEFCKTFDARNNELRPLLEVYSLGQMSSLTDRYREGGDRAWVIDHNKSKRIYRDSQSWVVFGVIESGPACLTIFLTGVNAGQIFYLAPQPEFNILRPIARSFDLFLDRLVNDIPTFLQLIRARVALRGADGRNYGLVPIRYDTGAPVT
jgi:hypothetical protein